jgi:hypothetical protein
VGNSNRLTKLFYCQGASAPEVFGWVPEQTWNSFDGPAIQVYEGTGTKSMPSKFRLELVVTLDKDGEAKAIESARQHYLRGGRAARSDDRGIPQLVPANEFIEGTEQALMELLELNPLLSEANVEITSLSCRSIEPSTRDAELGLNGLDTLTSVTSRPDKRSMTARQSMKLTNSSRICTFAGGQMVTFP